MKMINDDENKKDNDIINALLSGIFIGLSSSMIIIAIILLVIQ
jgi:hypothetical protein